MAPLPSLLVLKRIDNVGSQGMLASSNVKDMFFLYINSYHQGHHFYFIPLFLHAFEKPSTLCTWLCGWVGKWVCGLWAISMGANCKVIFCVVHKVRKLVIVLILIPKLSLGVIGSQCSTWVALDPKALCICWIPKLSWGPICWGSQLKDIFIITKA
jgi:hypothetical protein